jgi:hypothetical protein
VAPPLTPVQAIAARFVTRLHPRVSGQ